MQDHTRIRKFWKPDGKNMNKENERQLKAWMHQHALSTAPGALTVLLHSKVHDSARGHLARTLAEPPGKSKRGA